MIISISPTSLPNGTNGVPYSAVTFSATGGTGPYTITLVNGSQMPSGLGLFSGVLEGTPNGNTNGVYDIEIQLTDSSVPANTFTVPYTITIQ
jgi:large repetitive protein